MRVLLAGMANPAFRRVLVVAVAAVAGLLLAASPALAHFCYREFSGAAPQNAAKGQAWITAEQWLDFLPEIAGFLPPDCADAIEEELLNSPPERLYMGPGLLAGGTLFNGKGNTPAKVGYLLTLPGCEELFEH